MKTGTRRTITTIISLIVALLAVAALVVIIAITQKESAKSYQDCVDKGYPIQETNPPQCVTPNGTTFIGPTLVPDTDDDETDDIPTQPPTTNENGERLTISVFFSQIPESNNEFAYTRAVTRTTDRRDMGTFALEQLIDGPSAAESAAGLFSPLKDKLSGTSNCAGKDFRLTVVNRRADLQFCRAIMSSGIGDDARITSTTTNTLLQFSSVDRVRILTSDGDCFGDLSGENRCLD